ncbi:tenascin-X isoform 2-T2 [Discoglossus pictus]
MPPLLPLLLLTLYLADSLTAPASPTPCPDSGVKALLKRLDILEKLVRDLKGRCNSPCCASVQTGADDPSSHSSPPCPQTPDSCPGGCGGDSQGICVDGQCQCKDGYMGDQCQLQTCPEDCNDQGRCVKGQCICFDGYAGPNCGSRSCLNDCQNQGRCEDGECICNTGYAGVDCSTRICPLCRNRGKCVGGICVCAPGFTGVDCGSRSCPKRCLNNGRCENGVCVCPPGFSGPVCGSRTCPNNCNGRGLCEDGACVCDSGFTGLDCSSRTCPNDCNDQGTCKDGVCICDSGFFGPDCGSRNCPEDCSEQGQCVSGVCVCDPGFVGPDCGTRVCSPECEKRGRCEEGECICDPGYAGQDCEIRTCPADCNKQGRCNDGNCICDSGYTGLDCGSRTCPNNCNKRGRCEDGVCICKLGFSGVDCGSKACPKDCSGHGQCVNGRCVCDAGFSGPICGTLTCPAGCVKHGRCVRGVCVCSPGYTGPDCSSKLCPKSCNNRGRCEDGACLCDSGYGGLDCGSRTCPNDCHNQGQCNDGVCVCSSGYGGVDCGTRTCPNDCNNQGRCDDGQCICYSGFTGLDCGDQTCPNNCNNQGQCADGQCICYSGFVGLDCSSRTCPNDCNNRGQCDDGECICYSGFTGLDCGSRTCPNDCNNRGQCDDGECICDSGFTGLDCGSRTCPNDCTDRGQCDNGKCICDSGFTDLDCGSRTCPNDCNNQGRCDDGECICDSGYIGMDCGSRTCLNNCNDQGVCDDGTCICDSGFAGEDCGSRTCPNNCHNHGSCADGKCICDPGYMDVDCSSRDCPENCNNQGYCEDGVCVCDSGYSGVACESRVCPDNCKNRGRCVEGICVCQPGFIGPNCGSKSCPKNCSDNGQCLNGKCVCNLGFSGPVCGARVCPSNCGDNGRCVKGVCICKKGFGGVDCSQEIIEVSAVTGLRVTSQEETAVTVEWDRPQSTPDTYEITFKAKKENGMLSNTVDGSLNSYRQTGLAPGEEYVVTIHPRKGQTVAPEVSVIATTRIETPHGLQVTDITSSSFLLRWDRPQSPPNLYIVTLVAPSGKERKLRVPGRGNRVRITGLEEGTLYRLNLRAERGQEHSEGAETTATTVAENEQKIVDEDQTVHNTVVTTQNQGRTKKIISSVSVDQPNPTPSGNLPAHVGQGEDGHETEKVIKKGSRVVHTTKKNIVTTIITTYHTQHHEDGEEFDVEDEDEHPATGQDKVEVTTLVEEGDLGEVIPGDPNLRPTHIRKKVPGHILERWVVRRNITHFGTSEEETPTFLPEENEGSIIWQKGVTRNTYSRHKLPHPDWISETSDVGEGKHTTLIGTSSEDSKKDDLVTQDHQEGGLHNHYSQKKIPVSGNNERKETLSRERDQNFNLESDPEIESLGTNEEEHVDEVEEDNKDGTKKKKTTSTRVTVHRFVTTSRTKSGGKGDLEHQNETGVERDVERTVESGVRSKNQTRAIKVPIFPGSHIKSVIENLPEKLSLYNGTFIQRLESYLRATNYPLKGNRTVETAARAIFLYLVKWKPDSFTELVYDRLPQKTPGATGNPEPVGASRIRGNTGSAILEKSEGTLEDVTDRTHQTQGKKPKDQKNLVSSDLTNLGRVEAAGEVEVPKTLTIREHGSISDLTESKNIVISSLRETGKEDTLETTTTKPMIDKIASRGPQKKKIPPKKPSTSDKKKDEIGGPKSKTDGKKGLDVEEGVEKIVEDPKVKEYEVVPDKTQLDRSPKRPEETGMPARVTQKSTPRPEHSPHAKKEGDDESNTPKSSLIKKTKPSPVKEDKLSEESTIYDSQEGYDQVSTKQPQVVEAPGLREVQEGEERRKGLQSTETPDEERQSSLLEKGETEEKANGENTSLNQIVGSTIQQGKTDPIRDNFHVPGHGTPGRPGILTKTTSSLVVSLEGLGVLWDKVLVLYRQWPPIHGASPQQMEVERGSREVEIGGLEPGTSYRIDLHGLVRGRSSKSYSLITLTAMEPTTSQVLVTVPPTEEVTTSKPTTVTKRPQGPIWGALQVRDVTSDSVTLVWKARPGTFESFLVRYEDVTDSIRPQETSVPGDQREVTLTGLNQNTRYSVSVYGVRNGKLSRPLKEEVTTESSSDRGTPPRLSPLSVTEVQTDSFLVSWEPLDGDFDAFMLMYGPPDGPVQEMTLRGDQTSIRLTGLEIAVNYTVKLRGVWGERHSEPEIAHVLTVKPQPPQLESLSISDVRSDSILLSWDVQGGEFDSFLLAYNDAEGNPQKLSLEGDLRTIPVKDLKPAKKYKFSLYGIFGGKRGKAVTAETITKKRLPPRLESISVSDARTDSVDLSWVVENGDFDSFLLTYRDAEGKPTETILDGDERTVTVTDLRPGKKYKFVLYGILGGKRGKAVIAEISTAPLPPTPSATRLVDLQASDIGRESVKLSWTVKGDPPFEWIVVQFLEHEGGVRELQVPGGDTSTVVLGLLPAKKYEFTVYGVQGEKRSKPLITEVMTAYPEHTGKPTSSVLDELFLYSRGPHSLLVSWEAPLGYFENFRVRYGPQGHEGSMDEVVVDGTARTLLLTSLLPDTLYNVTLFGVREGNAKDKKEDTGRTGPLELQSPRDLKFTDIKQKSVIVSWDPPNPETTTFKVSYQPADGGEPESVSVVGTSTPLTGLNPGTRYEVTVVTVRGFEESQPLTGYTTTVGGGPRSLRAHDVTEESALLRWEAPLGPVDKYIVIYRAENVPEVTVDVPGDRTELLISGLLPHTEYTASVQSTQGSKTSPPTSTSFTTSDDTPRDLSASQITARSALLTWTAPESLPDGYLLTYQTPEGQMQEITLLPTLSTFILTELTPLTLYRVQLRALHGRGSSAPISTSFTTGRVRYPFPRDCWEQRQNGDRKSGIFNIYMGGSRDEPMPVYCDMETDGGGWIVFQRRMDGSINFFRDWNEYRKGFGNLTSEFWLGNTALHRLSSIAPFELRIDLRAGEESAYAMYDDFRVEAENQYFKLRLGQYRGNAGDSMSYHNNMIFSTRDRDAQKRILPCAMSYRGAWWYRNCHYANLNGMYANNKDHQGINWFTWKGFEFSIPFTEMKMRPRGVGNRQRF